MADRGDAPRFDFDYGRLPQPPTHEEAFADGDTAAFTERLADYIASILVLKWAGQVQRHPPAEPRPVALTQSCSEVGGKGWTPALRAALAAGSVSAARHVAFAVPHLLVLGTVFDNAGRRKTGMGAREFDVLAEALPDSAQLRWCIYATGTAAQRQAAAAGLAATPPDRVALLWQHHRSGTRGILTQLAPLMTREAAQATVLAALKRRAAAVLTAEDLRTYVRSVAAVYEPTARILAKSRRYAESWTSAALAAGTLDAAARAGASLLEWQLARAGSRTKPALMKDA